MINDKKYNYIYKTTNLLNNKFYIGMHSTDVLDDNYLGSGTLLRYSIKKYGQQNFKKQILEFFPDRISLKQRESEIINQNLLDNPLCMNLAFGGGGGWLNEEHKQKNLKSFLKAGRLALKQKRLNNPEWYKNVIRKGKITINNNPESKLKIKKCLDRTGKHHTEQTKIKIGKSNSVSQLGGKNSQYGTKWITNGIINKKIKKCDNIPIGWSYGRIIIKH